MDTHLEAKTWSNAMYAVRRPTQNFCLFSIPEGQAGFEELEGGHQVAAPFPG